MRVSRTRFSKRRIKRKTEFPIVAVVQKKRKVESIKSLTFGILNNQSGVTNNKGKQTKTLNKPKQSSALLGHAEQNQVLTNQGSKEPAFLEASLNENKTVSEGYNNAEQKKDKATQKNIASKPQKKSRATIDYKNIILLRNLITAEGKILPRRINKATAKQQRYLQKAIKSARIMGLIPFINKSRPF